MGAFGDGNATITESKLGCNQVIIESDVHQRIISLEGARELLR